MAVGQKAAISFALVYIPVDLFAATEDGDIRFNQLAKKTQARVRYKKVDESTGKEIANDEIVKAYQYDKGKYVVVTDEDFEKIKTDKDRSVQIVQFTDLGAIPPVYYKRSYYVTPQKGGEKPFSLLRKAMLDKGKVAIGKTVLGSRETSLMLMPSDSGLLMETMFFEDEIRAAPREAREVEVNKTELDLAEKLIDTMDKPFAPEQFKDEYQAKLRAFIESKIEGREVAAPAEPKTSAIADLMDALQASLDQTAKPAAKPARKRKKKAG